MSGPRRGLGHLLVVLLGLLPTVARAQEGGDPPTAAPVPGATAASAASARPSEVDAAYVAARLASLPGDATVDEAQRTLLTDRWTQVQVQLERAQAAQEQQRTLSAELAAVPDLLDARRRELASEPVPPAQPPPDASLAELEAALAAAEGRVREAEAEVAGLAAERGRRALRRTEIPKQVAAAREKLATLVEPAGDPGTESREAFVQRWIVRKSREALEAEIAAADRERENYDARTELLTLREDLATRKLATARAHADALRQRTSVAREQARRASLARAEANRELARDSHPAQAAVLLEDARLLDQRAAMAREGEGYAGRQQQVAAKRSELADRQQDLLDTLQRTGLTTGVASQLRRQRALLEDAEPYHRDIAGFRKRIVELEVELSTQDRLRSELASLDNYVDELMSEHPSPEGGAPREALRVQLHERAATLRDTLDATQSQTSQTFDELVKLESEAIGLVAALESLRRIINENALWIRNAPVLDLGERTRLQRELGEWLEPDHGLAFVAGVRARATDQPGVLVGMLAAGALLVVLRARGRQRLARLREEARGQRVLPVRSLLATTTWTVVVACCWPGLVAVTGSWLGGSGEALTAGVGDGLMWAGLVWVPGSLLGTACRNEGLAQVQLRWSPVVRRRLSSVLPVAGAVTALAVLVSRVVATEDEDSALGRLALLVALAALAAAPSSLLRPGGSIARDLQLRRPQDKMVRVLPMAWLVVLAPPVSLICLLVLGYQDGATRLTLELLASWVLVSLVLLGHGVGVRWLTMERRQARLEAARQAREQQTGEEGSGSSDEAPVVDPLIDADVHDAQARRLLGVGALCLLAVGFWLIWADTLPALAPLQHTELWSVEQVDAAGVVEILAITPVHLLRALVILVLSIVAARNLPGLLDVAIFRQLGLESSMAYALSTVSRYVVTTVGLLLLGGALGVQWEKVQWLVAAMGLGLGFGLQEIFGNFVSGLILLFEQRVRVGDVVTVGSVSGTVLRIRVLATTVQEWDRKEFVVPNKDLVTGTLLNWTLSDSVNRIKIDVGVAYGSDTTRARELLLEAARSQPNVLTDPAPSANFEAFGDSALMLSLRCFITGLQDRLPTITRVHEAIHRTFAEAGIVIAFPQLDVHMDPPPADGDREPGARAVVEADAGMVPADRADAAPQARGGADAAPQAGPDKPAS